MGEKSKQNLYEAFVAEAKAHFRLMAYARRAEEEGFPAVASLFRAVAASEAVHASNAFSLLERVGDTQHNLRSAFETEQFVSSVAYPKMLKEAWAEGDQEAVWVLTKARNVEERHAKFYRDALSDLVMDRVATYYVCGRCGWIEDRPPKGPCPNCDCPPDSFSEVR